jgi:PleD family two-component response regulator
MGIYIALPDNDEADIKKIIKGADEALYEAKNKGRNKASLYKG